MAVSHWNTEEFAMALAEGGVLAADFYADWCMPCKMMAPELEQLSDMLESRGLTVGKINVDEEPELTAQFGIQSIPCVILFKDGVQEKTLVRFRTCDDLLTEVEPLL